MDNKKLSILQLNDVHSYLELHQEIFREGNHNVYRRVGGYGRIATVIKKIREDKGEILVLDNGDTFHGTYPAVKTQGAALISILNELGIDAMTAHWDFAYGPARFKEIEKHLNYPVIANNVYYEDSKERMFSPYIIKEKNGLKLGIIGIASNIVDKTMPPSFSEGVFFTLGKDELPGIIKELKDEEDVDLVILLSHLGFPQEMQLLSEVKGIDICLSGHTHNRLYEPAFVDDTIVIQSGCHGSFVGSLDIEVNDKRIVKYNHELIEVEESIIPDEKTERLIEVQMSPYRFQLSKVVGETLKPLDRGENLETTMDNFILKSILNTTNADMAFSNGWRYGAPVIPGEILMNDLYNMVPTNPYISIVDIKGSEVKAMIEENIENTFAKDAYNQMGGYIKRALGITVYFKLENPKGNRVQKIFLGDKEIEMESDYKAGFITVQGVPKKYGKDRVMTKVKIIDSMIEYLDEKSPLDIELNNTFVLV